MKSIPCTVAIYVALLSLVGNIAQYAVYHESEKKVYAARMEVLKRQKQDMDRLLNIQDWPEVTRGMSEETKKALQKIGENNSAEIRALREAQAAERRLDYIPSSQDM